MMVDELEVERLQIENRQLTEQLTHVQPRGAEEV
jgi:hypothetical protein